MISLKYNVRCFLFKRRLSNVFSVYNMVKHLHYSTINVNVCAFSLWFNVSSGLYRSQCYAYLRLVFHVILYIQCGLYKYFSGLILVFLLLFALGVRHG